MITRSLRVALVLTAVLAAAVGHQAPAHASGDVLGSGSTFAEVALDQWAADIYRSQGLKVDFSGIGSSAGLNNFQSGIVDFASSDVPYRAEQPISRDFVYTPIVAGGTAILYNLVDGAGKRIDSLRLTPRLTAEIFFGLIGTWDDERIMAENPHLQGRIPQGLEIKLAVRTSGSGTTGVFTDFLSSSAPDLWSDFVARSQTTTQAGGNYTTDWPGSRAGFDCRCSQYAGSNEIANVMKQNTPGARGSIGYAETAYAIQLGIPVAFMKNNAGNYTLPTARAVAVALLDAVENPDGTQNLEGVFKNPRDEAYLASSYNYLVLPKNNIDPAKGATLGKYLLYSVTEGQAKADALGYSPLPPNLVDFALNKLALIPGAPERPPLGDWGSEYLKLQPDIPKQPDVVAPGGNTGGTTGGSQGGDGGQSQGGGGTEAGAGDGSTSGGQSSGGQTGSGGSNTRGSTGSGSTGGQTPTATTVPCPTPTTTVPGASTTTTVGSTTTTSSTTTTTVAGAPTSTSAVTTTTIDPCAPGAGASSSSTGSNGGQSAAASGNQVLTGGEAVESGGGGAGMVRLAPGLEFVDGVLVSKDGKKVPEVKSVGVGPLLGAAGVLAALVLLPPALIGTNVFRRRRGLGL